MTKPKPPEDCKPAGRPRIELNEDQAEQLATIGCTDEEIGLVLGCSPDTVSRRKADTPEFAARLAKGRATLKSSLRRAQYESGIKHLNVKMLIWMGKQLLDQRDRQSHEITGPDGGPVQLVTPDEARVRLLERLAFTPDKDPK